MRVGPAMWRVWSGIGCMLLSFIYSSSTAFAAGFSTNFLPTQSGWSAADPTGGCGFADVACYGADFANGDTTPFEYTVVNVGGQWYFRTLVGDPATGFAIEAYTPWGAGPNGAAGSVHAGDFSPSAGGNETLTIGNGGPGQVFLTEHMNDGNPLYNVHASGNGSQDPSKVVVRMVLTSADGTMSLEYYKPFLDRKPMITQTIEDGGMTGVFSVDMRDIGYQDMNTPINITNNLEIIDPNIPDGSGNYESALAQTPDVSAGRYTYAAGTGWNNPLGWDTVDSSFGLGTYTYLSNETGFDPYTYDWGSVFDHAQNALDCARVGTVSGVYRDGLDSTANGGGPSCPN